MTSISRIKDSAVGCIRAVPAVRKLNVVGGIIGREDGVLLGLVIDMVLLILMGVRIERIA